MPGRDSSQPLLRLILCKTVRIGEGVAKSGNAWLSAPGALTLALIFCTNLSAHPADLAAADTAAKGLKEITAELTNAVAVLRKHLDEAITRSDRGYRLSDGRRMEAADADLNSGQADVVQTSLRKAVAFRMLAARSESWQPAAAADIDRIQALIAESRRRVEASSAVLRRLLVVSIDEINTGDDTQAKLCHARLLKARAEAQEAAKLAYLTLPIDLPPTDSPEESAQKAWDLHVANRPGSGQASRTATSEPDDGRLNVERLRRFTLVREVSLRVALTDSGIEDNHGRHIFYQEAWRQRGPSVVWERWRVAVEPATGRHTLLKRYPPLEFSGSIDRYFDLHNHSLWSLEPPDDAAEPARGDLESAIAEVERSRDEVQAAIRDFRSAIRDALLHDDRMREMTNELLLDGGLSPRVREALYAIREHLAGAEPIVNLEKRVRSAVARADASVRALQPLAAWANRKEWAVSTDPTADKWEQLFDQSDREIDLLRSAEATALAALPPNPANAEDKFPPLEKDLVIRIRSLPYPTGAKSDPAIRYLQEVWRRESRIQGSSEVRRTATVMLIDPKTGLQTRAASNTRYYPMGPGDLLEEVFEEFASQDLIVAGIADRTVQ